MIREYLSRCGVSLTIIKEIAFVFVLCAEDYVRKAVGQIGWRIIIIIIIVESVVL